ncbi:MAG: GNAT family N-acetyltransferase [Paenisporosarcina sp.]
MELFIQNMNEELARTVISWKYEKPYHFYNSEFTDEELNERLNGTYFALLNKTGDLYGFFCIGDSAQVPKGNQFGIYTDGFVDMGLGMNPKLVGKGYGIDFCSYIVRYLEEEFKSTPIRLTVAKFNQRAIHLYEKLGFSKNNEFETDFAEFMTMVKKPN